MKLILLLFATLLTNCAHRSLKNLPRTPVGDVVNHNLLDSMGIQVGQIPAVFIDPNLGHYRDDFIAEAKKRGVNVTNESRDLLRVMRYVDRFAMGGGTDVIAVCGRFYTSEQTFSGPNIIHWTTIEVLKKESEEYTGGVEPKLREVLFHELFHCLLNKEHLPAGKEGLMAPVFNKHSTRAITDWSGLLDDAFSPDFMNMIPNTL